jgi:hypothetical protein
MRIRTRLDKLAAKLPKPKRIFATITIYEAPSMPAEAIESDIARRHAEAGYTYRPGDPILSIIVDPWPAALTDETTEDEPES